MSTWRRIIKLILFVPSSVLVLKPFHWLIFNSIFGGEAGNFVLFFVRYFSPCFYNNLDHRLQNLVSYILNFWVKMLIRSHLILKNMMIGTREIWFDVGESILHQCHDSSRYSAFQLCVQTVGKIQSKLL